MANIQQSTDPLELIRISTSASEEYLTIRFMEVIKKLYQYQVFKPLLDLSVSMIIENRLLFKIQEKTGFELDEGNCQTVESGFFDSIRGIFNKKNRYTITIKKISPDVIIHEIGHMVEGESEIDLSSGFNDAIIADIKDLYQHNLSLTSAIKNILVLQVANYPNNQKAGELFTRYFQLLAMSKEVAGKSIEYSYLISEMYRAFPRTEAWLFENLYKPISAKVNPGVVFASTKYIKPIEEIEHHWAGEKIQSTHHNPSKPTWRKTIKSIKD